MDFDRRGFLQVLGGTMASTQLDLTPLSLIEESATITPKVFTCLADIKTAEDCVAFMKSVNFWDATDFFQKNLELQLDPDGKNATKVNYTKKQVNTIFLPFKELVLRVTQSRVTDEASMDILNNDNQTAWESLIQARENSISEPPEEEVYRGSDGESGGDQTSPA